MTNNQFYHPEMAKPNYFATFKEPTKAQLAAFGSLKHYSDVKPSFTMSEFGSMYVICGDARYTFNRAGKVTLKYKERS